MNHTVEPDNPLFGVMRNIVNETTGGTWITWYHDPNAEVDIVTGVYGDELSALRAANNTECRATLMPHGEDIPTTLALAR